MNIVNYLPLTKLKIALAKILYILTKVFVKRDIHTISRNGINYEVDLSEGLDLSLFLFGNFQTHVSQNKYVKLPPDAVVIDIGANVGIMSLQFAKTVPEGKVYAFEPTHYAFKKLIKNLDLNPELRGHIYPIQSFVISPDKINEEIIAYSSWKVGKADNSPGHPVHKGTAMSTEGVSSLTLDLFCERENIERIDFMKIDTDGHEPDVFKGAKNSISKFRPKIIFEIGQYVMKEKEIGFDFYTQYFNELNYQLYNSTDLKEITLSNYKSIIPKRGTIDILALPN